jgi:hypothetical protein
MILSPRGNNICYTEEKREVGGKSKLKVQGLSSASDRSHGIIREMGLVSRLKAGNEWLSWHNSRHEVEKNSGAQSLMIGTMRGS